ncbi:hypothetical protein Tco_0510001, partial [Tanacetum coccineum]
MRNVCEVEMEWVTPILQKLEKLNVKILRLSEKDSVLVKICSCATSESLPS